MEKIIDLFRHGQAIYKNIEAANKKDPMEGIDYDNQLSPDLTEVGIENAKKKATEYFKTLNKENDLIFIVSSNESRAIETANYFRLEAHQQGFDVVNHNKEIEVNEEIGSKDKTKRIKQDSSRLANELGEGEIRTLKMLSLDVRKMYLHSIFIPDKYLDEGDINFDKMDPEIKKKFLEAKEIIKKGNENSNESESWGSNFYNYSEDVKKIFPELKSVKDLYEKRFRNILKLVEFADEKARESSHSKKIKILAFGHENYLSYSLNKHFADHEIGYCEAVGFDLKDDKVVAEFKGQEKHIE